MKMKDIIFVTVVTLAGNMSGIDGVELLKKHESIDSVSVTTTNLTIWFNENKSRGLSVLDKPVRGMTRSSHEYAEKNDPLILAPDDSITLIYQYNCVVKITPVSLKKTRRGFKISDIVAAHYGEEDFINTAYIVLSDKPTEVSEDDVEMIIENGEWITFEKPQPVPKIEGEAQVSTPSREESAAANVATASLPSAEDETQRLEAVATIDTPPNRLWLFALIAFCAFFAILYFLRRKKR